MCANQLLSWNPITGLTRKSRCLPNFQPYCWCLRGGINGENLFVCFLNYYCAHWICQQRGRTGILSGFVDFTRHFTLLYPSLWIYDFWKLFLKFLNFISKHYQFFHIHAAVDVRKWSYRVSLCVLRYIPFQPVFTASNHSFRFSFNLLIFFPACFYFRLFPPCPTRFFLYLFAPIQRVQL